MAIDTEALLSLGAISSFTGALFGAANSQIWADAYSDMATTNAGAMEAMAQTNAGAAVSQTRWQVIGMVMTANMQYLNSIQQLNYADKADRRAHYTARRQLDNDLKAMTLGTNAAIHAMDTEYNLQIRQMEMAHQERLAALEQPLVEETVINLEDVPL